MGEPCLHFVSVRMGATPQSKTRAKLNTESMSKKIKLNYNLKHGL